MAVKNLFTRIMKHREMIFPVCFWLDMLVNICFFYLGLAYRDNPARKYGFILCCAIYAVICLFAMLQILKEKKLSVKSLCLLAAALIFYGACFAARFVKFGFSASLDETSKFIIIGLPALVAGICGAVWGAKHSAYDLWEKLSWFFLPAAVIYLNGKLFGGNPFNYGNNLGIITYQALGYLGMLITLVHLVQYIHDRPYWVPFKGYDCKRPQVVRLVMLAVYWAMTVATGTRGAFVCMVVAGAFVVVVEWVHKSLKKRTVILIALILGFLGFNVLVYPLPGMQSASSRMQMVVEGLKNGEITTAREDPRIKENLQEIIQADAIEEVNIAKEDETEEEEAPKFRLSNRSTIYRVAIGEFLKSPITGMGPGGFELKYGDGLYPHNAILQILCETGLMGGIPFLAFVVFLLVRLWIIGLGDKKVHYMLLVFLVFGVYANISGSLWVCCYLYCAIGYGIACRREPQDRLNP